MRSAELTLPGFVYDVCSAIHLMAAESPFFKTLPLQAHGLEYLYPPVAAAHPFDDGTAAALVKSLKETAGSLGPDARAYQQLVAPVVEDRPDLAPAILGPLRLPRNPVTLARFGAKALLPAQLLANSLLTTPKAHGL